VSSVRDYMHRGLITCPPEAPLVKVAGLLRQHRIHGVLVIDGQDQPMGVVSDTDLLAGEWLGGNSENLAVMRRMTAGELMTTPVATIPASSDAKQAAAEIRKHHVARLVVIDAAKPVGVVSVSDLLAALPHEATGRSRVEEVMSWGYVACRPSTPVAGAARAMLERDSRSIIVVGHTGKPVGVVTGHDLLVALTDGTEHRNSVSEFMNPPVTISPDATLPEAVDLMLTKEIHRLVVVDPQDPEGPPLGLISSTDIMVEMAAPGSAWA
jgi:CBS domain-containing protein